MNELEVKKKEVIYVDSREVAEMLGKSHKALLKDIQGSSDGKSIGIIPTLTRSNFDPVKYFVESTYVDSKGETRRFYLVTKMGCEVLGNKQQGTKGILFTTKYVERFNAMEESLKSQSTLSIPSNYKEALQQLLLQVEQNEELLEENTKLHLDNKCLSGQILEWADRSKINFGIRKLALQSKIAYGSLWNELYQELKYKSHIDLKARGKSPFIQYVKEDEWTILLETFSAICNNYDCSPSEMLN